MKTKKSIIFILIGLYGIIFGAFSIFLDIIEQINYLKFFENMQEPFHFDNVFWFLVFILILDLILFVGGIAFLLRRIWGKILIQTNIVIRVAMSLYLNISLWLNLVKLDEYHREKVFKPFFMTGKSFLAGNLFEFIILIILFYLITRPKVKEQFK